MIDPELASLVDVLPVIELDDMQVARDAFEQLIASLKTDIPGIETLEIEDRLVPGHEDDPDVPVRVYRPKEPRTPPVPGILQIHGGGFVIGSVEAEHAGAVLMSVDAGAVLVSVEYRLAPEHPYPAGLRDCYAALTYLHEDAGSLGVDPARVAVVGTSAGG